MSGERRANDPITPAQVETLRRIHDWLKDERDQVKWQATRGTERLPRTIAKLTAEVDALAAALRVVEKVGKMPAQGRLGGWPATCRLCNSVPHTADCLEPDRCALASWCHSRVEVRPRKRGRK